MPKPLLLQPLVRVFERDPQIASWAARAKQESALTAAVRHLLPRPLAGRVRVAGAHEAVLELAVAAGAVAAVVRQRTPLLIAALRHEGWDFNEIRIRVQVGGSLQPNQKIVSRQLDANATAALSTLESRLPDGPLRHSIARWRLRARKA